jgi:hypothetical protein
MFIETEIHFTIGLNCVYLGLILLGLGMQSH